MSMRLAGKAFVVFATFEVRQNVFVRPTLAAHSLPVIVIFRAAAHVHHCIDRAAATEHAALNHHRCYVVLMTLRLQCVTAKQITLRGFEVSNRHVDVWVPITGTLLE
ncbi:hypothetical protein D3C80_1271480 [compost metagenome]